MRIFALLPDKRRIRSLSAGILALLLCAGPATAEMVLERVVLIQRHGVRAPTQSPETLAEWTRRPWPQWPVARGLLTPHGAQVVGLVADAIRARYVAAGILPATGCPGTSPVVWADGKDQRTRESGRVLAEQLAPGCGATAGHGPDGKADRLFNALGGACVLDPAAGTQAVRAAIGAGGALVDPASAEAIRQTALLFDPAAPPLPPKPSDFVVEQKQIRITGPLGRAATAAEVFLLEYAQGLPSPQVAWGEAADVGKLDALLAARARVTSLNRKLPYIARLRGAGMARTMLAVLRGDPRPAAPEIGKAVRLVAFAGHDTNLSNMAGVFGVDWSLPGQPDATAPATAFALERWRDSRSGAAMVRATIFYAELDGMRVLDPAKVHAVPVPLPDCPDGTCPLEAFTARILSTLPAACGR
ncbi:phosphoanhydride phosphorylase [Azorhizobium oxalatiphilum]|uniref:Phosphoanhydride phosphorylase n=1 Tax=Azorhizobium oxalatiphilum TaxID=980631 RepID=A0A917CFB1_9HYPH|nr:histidine-type phosphatase [Azorhizobium oxalatiphilum]GGF87065.1 phosphoanhydride phosphorylase [Azorhizobium oxalatiphilum]